MKRQYCQLCGCRVNAIELEIKPDFNQPVVTGAGLVALDVVIGGHERMPRFWVGGSCGNILTILAYFGWRSFPIAYIGKDTASEIMLDDLDKWGVKTNFIFSSEKTFTPIIVERIKDAQNGAYPTHVFEFKCPFCGAMLPRNKHLPTAIAETIIQRIPNSNVFYFDRVSSSVLALAKIQKSKGALIVFEPHRLVEKSLFRKCLEISDIVKYSSEQIKSISAEPYVPLEIQTLGARGLRYRLKNDAVVSDWTLLAGLKSQRIVDSAGAGDWCTAGIIHFIGQRGAQPFRNLEKETIERALSFGQRLSTIKCSYEGPRGLMYYIQKRKLQFMLDDSFSEPEFCDKESSNLTQPLSENHRICPQCLVNNHETLSGHY